MKKIDIKNNLKSALEKSTPDCFYKINNGVYVNDIDFSIDGIKKSKKKTLNFNLKYALTISACLLLMFVGLGMYYVPVNDIYLDINPSIEIKTNLFDKVIVVNAKNDDGTSIVNSIDIKNKNIDIAIDDIMNEMISQGFIKSDLKDNAILISVNAKSEEQAKKISESIDQSVNKKLNENNITAVVMKQELKSMKDLQALSKDTGVSVGKLQFIQKMIDKNNENIDASSLYNLKIKELLAYAEKNNLSTEDIVDEIEDIIDDMDDDDDEDEEDDEDDEDDDDKNKIDKVKDKNNKNNNIDKNHKGNDKKENNKKDKDDDDDIDDKDDDEDDEDDDDKEDKIKDKKIEKDIKKNEQENKKSEQKNNKKDQLNKDTDNEEDDNDDIDDEDEDDEDEDDKGDD